MKTQANATYGLSLSPIRANFQKVPRNPFLFLSNNDGHNDLRYAQVQTSNRRTVNSDWKLNNADIFIFYICYQLFTLFIAVAVFY